MTRNNEAHALLNSIGVPTVAQPKQAHGTKNASATKKGPGRYHFQRDPDEAKPVATIKPRKSTAGPGFVLHAATTAKRNRRARIKALGGIRQFKRRGSSLSA